MPYGVNETNGLAPGQNDPWLQGNPRRVGWEERGLRIVRLRLLSDPGFPMWDVSYCYGYVGDEPVIVALPFDQLPKRGMHAKLIEYAKQDRVYLKAAGIFSAISTLN